MRGTISSCAQKSNISVDLTKFRLRAVGLPFKTSGMEAIESLFAVEVERRDEAWEKSVLTELGRARVRVVAPEPQEGPDHWPYLLTTTAGADDHLANVLEWLSTRGIGLVLNADKPTPDFVLTYGMIWNWRERAEFISTPGAFEGAAGAPKSGRFEIKDGQELLAGPPTEAYLPKYVRSVIRQFFADQGVFSPKVLMISSDKVNFDLCFSIESLKTPPAHEHANIAEAVSWFLPAHYSVSLVSEKAVKAAWIAL